MRLPRHDGEVEGVVVKNDAVLELCVRGRARYAQAHVPKADDEPNFLFLVELDMLNDPQPFGC